MKILKLCDILCILYQSSHVGPSDFHVKLVGGAGHNGGHNREKLLCLGINKIKILAGYEYPRTVGTSHSDAFGANIRVRKMH